MHTTSLLNKSAVHAFALEIARQTGRPFKRVSTQFLERVEASLRTTVAAQVHAAPGKKTLT